jgi:DNA-binding NtrC family response regulator
MTDMIEAFTDIVEDGRPQVPVRQFVLRVTSGPDEGVAYTSAGERVTIGSAEGADLVLRDRTVSRFHCEITVNQDEVLVTDLGSRNRTLVNGVSIVAAHLHDRAVLTIGRTKLKFGLGSENVLVPLSGAERFGQLVGRSTQMRAVFALLERAARTEVTVLVLGETGTGKDVAAESIHRESERRDGPFVVVDCGAVPPTLLDNELFGHERGAFTGATEEHPGAVESADGGTLFIDEVGELPLHLQPKLLRLLDTRTTQRIGSTRRLPVNVRLIAATNRDLKVEVNARRFRPDLYYRLAVLQVRLPPLRERRGDVPLLVEEFLAAAGAAGGQAAAGAAGGQAAAVLRDPVAVEALGNHRWPGNVRELRNYVERCVALGRLAPPSPDDTHETTPPTIDFEQPLRDARERWLRSFERPYLEGLLRRHEHNVTAAARAAGVDRAYLYRLLARYAISR